MGQAPNGASYNDKGVGLPLIAGAGDFGVDYPQTKKFTSAPTKVCADGDIIVSIRATVGTKVLSDGKFCLGRGVAGLRPTPALNARYLWHWLGNAEAVLASKGRGATFPQVSRNDLAELEIPLPPLFEQRRIAAILDKADELRRKRKNALTLLEQLNDTLIAELVDSSIKVELGEIIAGGPTNGLYKPLKDYGTGVPILRINNFYDGKIVDLSSLRRLSVTDTELSHFKLTNDDIIINRVNSLEYLGKSAIVRGLQEPTVYESNMMRFSLNRSIMLPEVCIALLQTPETKRQILSKAKNAVNQSSINQRDVCSFRLSLPEMEIQRRFVAKVQTMRALEAMASSGVSSLNVLFSSLQSRAFSGQL